MDPEQQASLVLERAKRVEQLLKKYPVFQLKSILSKHNREKKLGIKLISKRRKGDVINYLLYHKYNLNELPNI